MSSPTSSEPEVSEPTVTPAKPPKPDKKKDKKPLIFVAVGIVVLVVLAATGIIPIG